LSIELSEYVVTDPETALIAHLAPLHPHSVGTVQKVSNYRESGWPLPFVLVQELPGEESVDESDVNALISVHTLVHKAAGRAALRDETDRTHRRMLWIATTLPTVALSGGRHAEFDYVRVVSRPHAEDYGDEQILRKVGRYGIGLSYARVP
jgi:hypothetical protein